MPTWNHVTIIWTANCFGYLFAPSFVLLLAIFRVVSCVTYTFIPGFADSFCRIAEEMFRNILLKMVLDNSLLFTEFGDCLCYLRVTSWHFLSKGVWQVCTVWLSATSLKLILQVFQKVLSSHFFTWWGLNTVTCVWWQVLTFWCQHSLTKSFSCFRTCSVLKTHQ